MQRIETSKLIQILASAEKQQSIYLILSDNPILKKVIEDTIEQKNKKRAKFFSGKNSLEEYVRYLSTCGMFEPVQPSLIDLPEKLTQKSWDEIKKNIARIPLPIEVSFYLFGSTGIKNLFKESDFPSGTSLFISYDPNEIDLLKCVYFLLLRYPMFAKKSKNELETIARLALESYSNDLLSCDMHFSRMEKGNLSFSAALAGNPEINGFHVTEAIALRDKHLIELRIAQCSDCGEEAATVFMAIVYFLKQVAYVLAGLEETKNLKLAFEKAKIPFPAQGRIQKAITFLNSELIFSFFCIAPKLEMELRMQKNPHKYLSVEILNWLK